MANIWDHVFITNKGVLLTYERKDLRPGSTDGDWKKAREC